MTTDVSEKQQSLWKLISAPLVWVVHLLACYVTAAVWCAKYASVGSFGTVRWAIAVYTLIALASIAGVGWSGWRRYVYGRHELTSASDPASTRHRFLGFATLLLAGASALAVAYQAMPAMFIGSCQ